MNTLERIKNQIEASCLIMNEMIKHDVIISAINIAAESTIAAYRSGKKTLWAGNGGSAADAQHLAGEMVSRFMFDRPALSAIALNTNTSILTAIGNDYGYNQLFARQIAANGQKGDVFFGLSTSGNSENIIEALRIAKAKELFLVGMTGNKECRMDSLCDVMIKVPSSITPRIQESHILIGHIICEIVERELFSEYAR